MIRRKFLKTTAITGLASGSLITMAAKLRYAATPKKDIIAHIGVCTDLHQDIIYDPRDASRHS